MRRGVALTAVIEALLPSSCCSCEGILAGADRGLCRACWSRVRPLYGTLCPRCGAPSDRDDMECIDCAGHPPPQSGTVVWGEYSGVLRRAVLALKHHGRDDLAGQLGQRLAAQVAAAPWADELQLVTAVPSHPIHRLRRGYSASELVARQVGAALGLPRRRLLRRRRMARQAGRSRAARLQMPATSFSARRRMEGARVLVVDDVTTTGTTLRRVASTILEAGASSVYCACVAFSPDSRRVS